MATLFAYTFPERQFKEVIQKMTPFLKGLQWEGPKWPHISIAYLQQNPNEAQRESIRAEARHRPEFRITGLELLSGQTTPRSYLAVRLDTPDRFLELYQWIKDRFEVKEFPEHKLHVSILSVPKEHDGQLRELLPQLERALKPALYPFTPNLPVFWENYEMTDISEWISEEFLPEWVGAAHRLIEDV